MTASGPWAVITGASSGIGRAFAFELTERGFPVFLIARREAELERVADEVARRGGAARIIVADLATAEGIAHASAELQDIDVAVLVNNAGVGAHGAFAEQAIGRETDQVALNIGAVVALTRRLLPKMIARGRGLVVNLASVLGFMSVPYFATYAATKAFVIHFSEALSVELQGTGVQVLAASPGVTKSDFARTAGSGDQEGGLPQLTAEHVARVAMKAADAQRVVRPIGATYRLLAFLAAITPRAIMRRIMGGVFAPKQTVAPRSRAVHRHGKWRGEAVNTEAGRAA
jgi:hypothetical protein